MYGMRGITPATTKDTKVSSASLVESGSLSYLPTAMEYASATIFAIPTVSMMAGFNSAALAAMMVVSVVMTPSIPP